MHDCLLGKIEMPDKREKSHDWDLFTELMLSTWIRRFTKEDVAANKIAEEWASIISDAFKNGEYSNTNYLDVYERVYSKSALGGRFTDFVNFYQVSLISDQLSPEIESFVFDYILSRDSGIYYLGYQKPLTLLPDDFQSKQTTRFISSIEMMAMYKSNRHKLKYAAQWIENNMNPHGTWDLGAVLKIIFICLYPTPGRIRT